MATYHGIAEFPPPSERHLQSAPAIGLPPLLLSSGTGSEVQRPLATVVIGGLLTSTALTLLVLPSIYRWFAPAGTHLYSPCGPTPRSTEPA